MAGDISVNQASAVLREAMRDTIRRRSRWYLIQGGILVVAGVVALVSPLLAARAELHASDPDGDALDRARERLIAHRLRA